MISLPRAILLSAALVAAFLIGALSLQGWLVRQARTLHASAKEDFAARVQVAVALEARSPREWDDEYRKRLGTVLGADLQLRENAPANPEENLLRVVIPQRDGGHLVATTSSAPLERLEVLQRRLLAATFMLALLLAALPIVIAALSGRRTPGESAAPWRTAKAEAAGLEQFARLSVERAAALEREQSARARVEENLQVSQTLLDRSLDERVRLGRELHDNISQTLYAVSLTLESVGKNAALPSPSEQRLAQSVQELRRLNREVRAYIRELEPAHLHGESFAVALSTLLAGIVPPEVSVEQRVQEDAMRLVPSAQTAEFINIVREAVSNSVRHGRATHVSVRAAHDNGQLALVVADNGAGFALDSHHAGHGLANMRARAAALGGELHVESAPGKGTRVILNLPLDSARS